MAEDNQVNFEIRAFSGQASGVNRESVPQGKSRLILNFLSVLGFLRKIPGAALYINSGIGTDPVKFLYLFQFRWIYQIGKNLIWETAEGSKQEQLLDATFDSDRINSDEWRGRLYLANGKQLRYFDGSSINELGILPPGLGAVPRPSGVTIADDGNGNLPGSGRTDYTFTYFDPITQTESIPIGALVNEDGLFDTTEFDANANPCGWIFYSITLAASRQVSIIFSLEVANLFFGNAPARATQVNMYRRDPGIANFSLVTTFNLQGNNSIPIVQAYVDNKATADLGVLMIPDQLTPPPNITGATNGGCVGAVGPKYIRQWRDNLYLLGASFPAFTVSDSLMGSMNLNPAADSILYASDTFLPDYYPFDYEVGRNDGQKPTGLAVVYDTLLVFKERSIYMMLGTNITNYILKIFDTVRGCIASGSLQETSIGAIFLAEDGFCLCNAASVSEVISEEIDDEIKRINISSLDKITSAYNKYDSNYWVHFPTGASTENNRFAVFNTIRRTWSVGDRYQPTVMRYGALSNGTPKLLAGKHGGRVIDVSSRTIPDDDGRSIRAIWRSADFDCGRRDKKKKLHWLYVTAACATDFIIDIAIFSDYAQGPIWELKNIDSNVYNAEFDVAEFDIDRFAGPQTFKRIKIPIQGIGRTFYVQISESQNDVKKTLFEIHSVEAEGKLLGK